MHPRLRLLIPILLILGSITGLARAYPDAPPTGGIGLVSPLACPGTGCAAGQTINLGLEFDLPSFDPAQNPNVQVCFFTSTALAVNSFGINPQGGLSGTAYTLDQTSNLDCGDTPVDYTFQGRATTQLAQGILGDMLGFNFRIGQAAATNGAVLARVFTYTNNTWGLSLQTLKTIPVAPITTSVFVANDSAACNNNSPCFINSGDDQLGGIGTGLKDAVDAVANGATVTVLGNYTIKSSTVVIPQALTLRGLNNASLTYTGSTCSSPMLDLRGGVTLTGLTINDGGCATPSRDLIAINSDAAVTLESNDLTNGKDAVHLGDFAGSLLVRFNQISENEGYAILADTGSAGAGQLNATANNLFNNRPGAQVECNQRGQVDHNFWGTGVLPSVANSNCTYKDARRLGAAILHNAALPGVDATQVTVTNTKTYAFNNQIGFIHSDTHPDLGLYIVNHGASGNQSIPFSGSGVEALSPCSNFWDVFLKNGETPAAEESLSLFVKYNLSSGCIATVESTSYCANTTINPPLWWYDPSGTVSNQWIKTGPASTGQDTTCQVDQDEIRVDIDSTGHPGIKDDLGFMPLVVGLQHVPAAVVLSSFTSVPDNAQVTVNWQTISEISNSGFYLQRSTQPGGPFVRLPDSQNSQFFTSKGNSGGSYSYTDTGLTNGTTYYYRLEASSQDGTSVIFGAIQAVPGIPTATPTFTATITYTPTITLTPTVTRTLTRTPSRTPTKTKTSYIYNYTPYKSPTPYNYQSPTPNSLTRTAFAKTPTSATPTRTPSGTVYPTSTGSIAAQTPGSGYPVTGVPPVGQPTSASTSATSSGYPVPAEPTSPTGQTAVPSGTASSVSTPASGLTVTPSPTPVPPPPPSPRAAPGLAYWLSMGAGGFLSAVVLLSGGFWLFKRRS